MHAQLNIAIVATAIIIVGCLSLHRVLPSAFAEDPPATAQASQEKTSPDPETASLAEVKIRARILHETLHGTLQVMHRDFFRKDQALKIPTRSLEDVFSEVQQNYGIELRWLAVDTGAMSVDNQADSELEKEAVRVLKSGEAEFEKVADNRYHFAGRIRLSAVCLSCHASARKNNDDRYAALYISLPLAP